MPVGVCDKHGVKGEGGEVGPVGVDEREAGAFWLVCHWQGATCSLVILAHNANPVPV